MAQKVTVSLLDDIDGSEAAGTLTFGFGGQEYAVDLNGEHLAEYNQMFEFLTQVGRVVGKAKRAPYGSKKGQSSGDTSKIREWLRAQGHQISDRGRIPNKLMEEYHQAQNVAQEAPQAPEKATPQAAMDPGQGTTTKKPSKPRAKVAQPKFKEALGEVLTLDTTKKAAPRRRTTTPKKPTSTTK